ncbi:hypothetical protein AOLI_G00163350 [Acnodon oligacanthus]
MDQQAERKADGLKKQAGSKSAPLVLGTNNKLLTNTRNGYREGTGKARSHIEKWRRAGLGEESAPATGPGHDRLKSASPAQCALQVVWFTSVPVQGAMQCCAVLPLCQLLLEPELEEVLVPRKLAVSPLESWLSLRYSLPPLLEAPAPLEEGELVEETVVLPPSAVPLLEDSEISTPLSCKNVLEIRRRKMNRHKYKKLLKRTKFLRRRVKEGRRKRKQNRFERDLTRIWRRAGLKKAPEGWTTPKIYVKHHQPKGS